MPRNADRDPQSVRISSNHGWRITSRRAGNSLGWPYWLGLLLPVLLASGCNKPTENETVVGPGRAEIRATLAKSLPDVQPTDVNDAVKFHKLLRACVAIQGVHAAAAAATESSLDPEASRLLEIAADSCTQDPARSRIALVALVDRLGDGPTGGS